MSVVAALPGVSGAAAAAAPVLPPTTRVADGAVAALLHALAAVGLTPRLIATRGHRPPAEGGGEGDAGAAGAAAAAALGKAAEAAAGGAARYSAARAARLVPAGPAVRAASAGGRHGGMTTDPESGGLMYS